MSQLRTVSPQAVFGFREGRVWVFVADTNQLATFPDASVLSVLGAFRSAAMAEKVIEANPSAGPWIGELEKIGALIDPGERKSAPEPSPGSLVPEVLSPLASSLDALAGALSGIGPEVAEQIRDETGVGLKQRLVGALVAFTGLESAIQSRTEGWVREQVTRLRLPERGLSLHLGSGSARLTGFVNIDVWPAELSMDFRTGLPFRDGSADRVYLSHVLEHLYYPREVTRLLREIHRVLAPGGRVRLIVPDIEACLRAYVDKDDRFFEGRKEAWPHWKATTRLEMFLGFAGVGPYPGMFGLAHKWGYDFETVQRVLREGGFSQIERSGFQTSIDPKLRVDEASSWAKLTVDGRYYSLFVEAVRE
ncbi:MAG: methyltransferase domain-containing protein [Deltaproteobacteria bacterium]|nr:methyltransferase domain-containing protein [Deltaproteobacteria bacterium]